MFHQFLEKSSSKSQDNSSNNTEEFCVVRWSDKTAYDIVHQRTIKASSNSIQVYETYAIEFDGKQRKGTVLLKGNKKDCEQYHYKFAPKQTPVASAAPAAAPKKAGTPPSNSPAVSASDIIADVREKTIKPQNEKEEKAVREAVLGKILDLIRTTKADADSGSGEKHNVQCSACQEKPIESDRYKCLTCGDVNLCATCFESRREPKQHKSGHVFVHYKFPGELFGEPIREEDVTYTKFKQKYANEQHSSIRCDGCGTESIKGLRYKCDVCSNYDLCQECVDTGKTTKTHETKHSLIIVPRRAIPQIPVEHLQLGDQLGSGAFGTVFKAKWIPKNRLVACKVVDVPKTKQAEVLERCFIKEISAYSELSGAFILKTFGFTASRHGDAKRYMLVMEYMSRGSLANVIKEDSDSLSLRRRLDMARNIASGIRKIHEHGMIHRDIRPDNILVNEHYLAKIGDMGIARMTDPLKKHTQIGCQSFMPPEFYKGLYDQKLDIFTFGLTLNVLFTSTEHSFQPFVSNDKIAFQQKSPIFDDLISRCTSYNPDRRPTAIEIEKTFDLYAQGFNEIVLKKHPQYQRLSKEDKDEVFMAFYEQFHPPATDFIRKQFPAAFLNDAEDNDACVKVDKEASECIRVECGQQ